MTTVASPPNLTRLVRWDRLDFLLSGERLAKLAGREIARSNAPVSQLEITFTDDLLRFDGKIRKTIAIPFTIEIDSFEPRSKSVHIHLKRASAFGIPLPSILLAIAQLWLKNDEVTYDADARVISVKLDRFLPPFVDIEIESIRPVRGGIAVRIGAGGADLPETSGGKDGEQHA